MLMMIIDAMSRYKDMRYDLLLDLPTFLVQRLLQTVVSVMKKVFFFLYKIFYSEYQQEKITAYCQQSSHGFAWLAHVACRGFHL
jgi:hypothetical protein